MDSTRATEPLANSKIDCEPPGSPVRAYQLGKGIFYVQRELNERFTTVFT